MEEWVHCSELPLSWIREVDHARRNPGNQRTKQIRNYKDLLCAWDIETARIPGTEEAACYHWQFQLGFDHPTIYGRYLEEFRDFLDRIAAELETDETLVVYVHGLHYEFHFLRELYEIKTEDVFALGSRKPVRVWLYNKKIELRCSYILTNMSLGLWTKEMKVAHKKEDSDDYDHTLVRYPWTDLSKEELKYCRHDVLGLIEALQVQLDLHGDSLATIPLTSTGYVRRDVKKCMELWSHRTLQSLQPSDEVYIALRQAFRGGNTHGNRYYTGCILDNVGSMDRSSSYPDVCINRPFPMTRFRRDWHRNERYLNKCVRGETPFLARLRFTGLRLADPLDPCPYISYSKCWFPGDPDRDIPSDMCTLDNGRIMYCDACDTTIIDVDWRIIRKHYKWDSVEVLDLWTSSYDFLPDILRLLIIKYYEDKTALKGVEGKELIYNLAKALLNSIYGLMAQDPCKVKTIYDPHPPDDKEIFYQVDGDIPKLLAKSRYQPYTTYQWSCWVCGWSRYELQQAIDAAGDNFVYCDTDSVKFVGDLDLSKYNEEKVRNSKSNGAEAVDAKGKTHYMGVFEDEGRYSRFVQMGAKRYAYEDSKGKIHVTVSGVNKTKGAEDLEAAGGLEAFREDFVFSSGGGLDPKYNDFTDVDMVIDGHSLHVGPNVYLRPSTYTLSLGENYGKLIDMLRLVRDADHDKRVRKALEPQG